MPDPALVATTSLRLDPVSGSDMGHTLARRLPIAAGVFVLAAAIALGFDVLHTPERRAAATILFIVDLGLCAVTTILVFLAPAWVRLVLSLLGPLLPLSIGIYVALVAASPESCSIALSLFLAGTAILGVGPVVQLLIVAGAAAGYACAASVSTAAPVPIAYSLAVLAGVAVLTLLASLRQRRRSRADATPHRGMATREEHERATALLETATVLADATHDVDALAAAAVAQSCRWLEADWAILWHRIDDGAFRVAAVAGLPRALADALQAEALVPATVAALYERITRHAALTLPMRDAQRLVPHDAVAPVLKHAIVAAVRSPQRIGGLLFAGYATRKAAPPGAETLLAGVADHLGIAMGTAHLLEHARNANRAKSEFIATMSHELRTPINVVMGYADLLIEGAFGDATPDQLEVLNRVRHQSAQLLDLVQPMLDLNRMESRQTSVAREPFRIADLIANLRITVPASWCKPGVTLSWEIPCGSDIIMHSDQPKIEMIIRNLIHNAMKYTDQGAVTVAVDAEASPGHLRIMVRDTGVGIAAEDMPVLFEMFGQSNSDPPRDGGVGMGLYIVKRLTDVLGGRVSVESTRGVGSTFTVVLPLTAPAMPD